MTPQQKQNMSKIANQIRAKRSARFKHLMYLNYVVPTLLLISGLSVLLALAFGLNTVNVTLWIIVNLFASISWHNSKPKTEYDVLKARKKNQILKAELAYWNQKTDA